MRPGPDIMSRLAEIENLPTLPVVVNRLQQLLANQRSSMAEIAAVIARDQAICARVIRLINSAFYGLQGRITSVHQAIVLLGLNTVKNLVTGVAIVRSFADQGAASLFDRERFWAHTFACALGAKLLAARAGLPEPEDYFLAGLMHDIGILVLDQFFHSEFLEAIQHAACARIDYLSAERATLGTTHCLAGELLALRWKLPEQYTLAVRHHHEPSLAPDLPAENAGIIAAVHIANAAASARGMHMGIPHATRPYEEKAARSLGIDTSDIDETMSAVEAEVKSLMREWGM